MERDRKARLSIDIETPATVTKGTKMPTPEAESCFSVPQIHTDDEEHSIQTDDEVLF